MAINTRTKRASVLGVGRPWNRTKEPDATKPEAWRIASGNAYGGNALTPSAIPDGTTVLGPSMIIMGDYAEDYKNLNLDFTTINPTTGVPFLLAGSPVISVYRGNETGTEKTSAETYITLTVDFDGISGLNHVEIDLSGSPFFKAGKDYRIVITTGTVDSITAVGYAVAGFSIENRANIPRLDKITKRTGLLVSRGP